MKKLVVGSLATALLASNSIVTSYNAKAVESNQNTSEYNQSEKLNSDEEKEFKSDLKNNGWHESQNLNGETTYTISDEEMVNQMKNNGNIEEAEELEKQIQKENDGVTAEAYGVNSIKFGKNGSFTLKLNKTVTQTLAAGGVGGATAAIAAIPGVGWSVAAGIAGSMGGVLTGASIKNGIVIKGKVPNKVTSWHWQ